jgi:hypothetical protein
MRHSSQIDGRSGRDKLVTFETQSRLERTWRTVAIFDDRPSAVAEAERILDGRRTPAVRVVQVVFDPASTECTEYTVFRATSFDQETPRTQRRLGDQEIFEWGADGRNRAAPASAPWIERHWPDWAPDWATTALGLSIAVLAVSVLFRWVK